MALQVDQGLGATEFVCWSRMQSEAGQALDAIVARKELERVAGLGVFFWGVGNPTAREIPALARQGVPVPVVFSIMKSKPRQADKAPSRVVAWRKYFDVHGAERVLPQGALVTSRGDSPKSGAKRVHYALMCRSEKPLAISRGEPFDVNAYRNAGRDGKPVGASQVTALLRQVAKPSESSDYEVNLRAQLEGGYWVRLSDPVDVPNHLRHRLNGADRTSVDQWLELTREIHGSGSRPAKGGLI